MDISLATTNNNNVTKEESLQVLHSAETDTPGTTSTMESSSYSSACSSSSNNSSAFDYDEDEDDDSLDGRIPCSIMSHYHDEDEDKDARVIHYLGHDYPADQFQENLSKCAEEFQMNRSMKLQESEHLSDRWTASAAREPSSRRLLSSSSHHHRPSSNLLQPPKSKTHGAGSMSQSARFTLSAGSNHQSLSSRSEHCAIGSSSTRRRDDSSLYYKLLGSLPNGALAALQLQDPEEVKKQQRWNASLQRWGYTNHDVLDIVQDDKVWAKLQRDLRSRKAITNTLIEQRIHVFVRNTKYKKQHQQKQQQQQQQDLHDEEPHNS